MLKKLGNYLITGTIIVLPLTVTIFLLIFLIKNIGNPVSGLLFSPIFSNFDARFPDTGVGKILLDFISTIIVLLIITGIGIVSKFFLGRTLISIFETLINKVPFAGLIYRTVKQIVDTFSEQNKAIFQSVVLVEFPRKGVFSVGFVTSTVKGEIQQYGDDNELLNVFVPTTPNPTSGFLMMVPKRDLIYLEMSVGDAMKLIISGGAVVPASKK